MRVTDRGSTTKLLPGHAEGEPALLLVPEQTPRGGPLRSGQAIRIGRADSADVVLDDSSLSRLHAQFVMRGDAIEVEDLDSSNGTVVRGERLAPGKPASLAVGDVV